MTDTLEERAEQLYDSLEVDYEADHERNIAKILSALKDAREEGRRETERWKHAYETATHDDCNCPVNNQGRIASICVLHGGGRRETKTEGLPGNQAGDDSEGSTPVVEMCVCHRGSVCGPACVVGVCHDGCSKWPSNKGI